ncbi:MAG: aldehyde dehydrogenase family protein [Planctomycetes bacterium]|nr:aldehyde dehydrogenase family protein [Planctomycetota bacterium]
MSEMLISTSPAEPERELGRFPIADAAKVHAAVDRAKHAFPDWRDAGFDKRAAVLRRFRDIASERVDEFAAELGFVVMGRTVGLEVALEGLDQLR